MLKRYQIRTLLCLVLALAMVFDIVVVPPAQAEVTKRDVALVGAGAAAGAGLVLAGPAIATALGAVGGTVVSVGGALLTGVGAVLSGVAGVVGSVIGAIGGVIAAIVSSPLFIPALVIAAVAIAGYFAYKAIYKKGYRDGVRDATGGNNEIITDPVYVAPTDYEMSNTIPAGDEPVSLGTSNEIITIASEDNTVTVSDAAPVKTAGAAVAEEAEQSGSVATENSKSLAEAQERYLKAYHNYTTLVTNSGGADSATINAALQEYRKAYSEYLTFKAAASGK